MTSRTRPCINRDRPRPRINRDVVGRAFGRPLYCPFGTCSEDWDWPWPFHFFPYFMETKRNQCALRFPHFSLSDMPKSETFKIKIPSPP